MKVAVLIISLVLTLLLFASIFNNIVNAIFGDRESVTPYVLLALVITSWSYMFYIL